MCQWLPHGCGLSKKKRASGRPFTNYMDREGLENFMAKQAIQQRRFFNKKPIKPAPDIANNIAGYRKGTCNHRTVVR